MYSTSKVTADGTDYTTGMFVAVGISGETVEILQTNTDLPSESQSVFSLF